MRTVKPVMAVVIVLMLTLGGCAAEAKEVPSLTPEAKETLTLTPEANETPGISPGQENTPEPAIEVVTGTFDVEALDPEKAAERAEERIIASAQEEGIAAEYWVTCVIAKANTGYYYKLRVYEDGTGKFEYIIKRSDRLTNNMEVLLYESTILNKEVTDMLLKAISDNDFWDIPTVNPDEQMGFDGSTISITGYSDGKAHHIRMWEPGKEYGIFKIFKVFYEYAKNVADDPLDIINIDDFGV